MVMTLVNASFIVWPYSIVRLEENSSGFLGTHLKYHGFLVGVILYGQLIV